MTGVRWHKWASLSSGCFTYGTRYSINSCGTDNNHFAGRGILMEPRSERISYLNLLERAYSSYQSCIAISRISVSPQSDTYKLQNVGSS